MDELNSDFGRDRRESRQWSTVVVAVITAVTVVILACIGACVYAVHLFLTNAPW